MGRGPARKSGPEPPSQGPGLLPGTGDVRGTATCRSRGSIWANRRPVITVRHPADESADRQLLYRQKGDTGGTHRLEILVLLPLGRQVTSSSPARIGTGVELEHGSRDLATDVSGNDPVVTGKIAFAHLTEFPDYYTRLAILEREAAADLQKK